MAPRKVTVKVLTVNKPAKQIFDFFSDVKNMEIGGVIKSVTKGGWGSILHTTITLRQRLTIQSSLHSPDYNKKWSTYD